MTESPSLSRALRPDARLVQLHAERSDPGTRLAGALADLESADWGLLLAGEVALARQLAALLGPGTLRVDGRIHLSRSAFAEAGLAVADLHGDLKGARAAVLFDPDERTLERARRAGVRIVVDATLSPGGGWPERGADYVLYRDAVTLTGHADAPLAALFGLGRAPEAAAPAPSDLSVALALRDVATLPLRLARAARTVGNLSERLGGSARPAGPTALLLPPEAAPDTVNLPGGVLAAVRHVPDGVLLTPGLEDTERVLALLRDQPGPQGSPEPEAEPPRPADSQRPDIQRPDTQRADTLRPETVRPRREEPRRQGGRPERQERRPERERGRFQGQAGQEQGRRFDSPRPPQQGGSQPVSRPGPSHAAPSQPEALQRFTFEAPASTSEEVWEPEIVFSDLAQTAPPLTHTVSNGPDAPDQREGLPDVLHQSAEALSDIAEPAAFEVLADAAEEDTADADTLVHPTAVTLAAAKLVEEAPIEVQVIAPDLPASPDQPGKDDPALNLTDEQAAIYARLREWRNAEAKRQEISRFIIASNATLAEIARRIPYTDADLKAVKGMGPERMKKYGQKILEVVRG